MVYYTDGNILSILVFVLFVPFALYAAYRLPAAKATIVVFLSGLMLLPEIVFFKPMGLPEFRKLEIVCIWILIGAFLFHRDRLRSAPRSRIFRVAASLIAVGAIVTVLLNTDGFRAGSRYVPGHVGYDAVHAVIMTLFETAIPFFIGMTMFRNGVDLRVLLKAVVVAAVLYSPLQFAEMALSPQLHRWLYGFHQHSFFQTFRDGHYRPMVFMQHGLAVAIFDVLAILAASALHRAKIKIFNVPAIWAVAYLFVVLLLSRSLASAMYAVVLAPLVLFAPPRLQAWVGVAFVVLLVSYPAARVLGLVPIEQIGDLAAAQFGEDRASSLTFRFDNEEDLVERIMERPVFGWGSFCRACLFEPWTGRISSIRDAWWVMYIGDNGFLGFFARALLFAFPMFGLLRRIRRVPKSSDQYLLAGLGLMIGICCFDLLINADYTRLVYLFSGALWSCLLGISAQAVLARRKKKLARRAAARRAGEPEPLQLPGAARSRS